MRRIVQFLLAALVLVSTGSASEMLRELVEQSELNGGLLYLPRVNDAPEVLALAEQTPFMVVACTPAEERATALRQEAAALGILAKQCYVEQVPDTVCPLAENSVSLLLVDDLVESDLTPARRKAWIAAISPRRGVAVVGNRKADRLDTGKLVKWASAEGARAEPLAMPGSSFVLIRKPAPEGSDVWTHRFHDPSNQRISRDTTLKAPFGPAWYALPTNLGYRGDIMVSDGGRAYYIWANRLFYHSVSLICFDIHNGTKLWEQPFKWDKPRDKNEAGYYAGRSCIVALPDGLLLVDEDRLAVLDGETGSERRAIAGPKPGGQIKWLGVEGDLVAVLAGEPDGYKTGTLQQEATNPFGTELAVYRISDGSLAWKRSEAAPVDERELAIYDGKLYAHTRGVRMACSELATGKLLWENSEPDLLEKLGAQRTGPYMSISYRILVATSEALYFAAAIRDYRVVMNRGDGTLLWSEKLGKTRLSLNDIVFDNTLIKHAKRGSSQGTVELTTNRTLEPIQAPAQGCGPSFCTTDFFITMFGQVSSHSGELLRRGDLKAPCDLGVVIADGVAFSPPSACKCNAEIHGFRAFTSLPGTPSENPQPQLVSGPAASEPLSPEPSQAEWRCWRGDVRHSGSLPVTLPAAAPERAWQWVPVRANPVRELSSQYRYANYSDPEHLPTQAVSTDGVAFFGDSQGVIRAISLLDGKELWSVPLGFNLTTPPALASGRVVVGTLNGQVVCLDAKTGRLAWRYRVPLRTRRMLWYGHLADSQPLLGGALVHDSTVYAAAGFSTVDSLRVVALDVANGKLKWAQDMPHDDPKAGSLGSMGAMTVAAGQLFIRSGGQVPVSFDLESGALTVVPDTRWGVSSCHGKDLAAIDDDWVLYGGRRVYTDFTRWKLATRDMSYSLCRTDRSLAGGSEPTILGARLGTTSALMPVFDEELVIAFGEYPSRKEKPFISAWKRQDFIAAVAGVSQPSIPEWMEKKERPFTFGTLVPDEGALGDSAFWTGNDHLVYAAALGADALVILHPEGDRLADEWHMTCIERGDGSQRWTMPLPGRPAWDGLSLSSDGSILIALWDGSMLCLK